MIEKFNDFVFFKCLNYNKIGEKDIYVSFRGLEGHIRSFKVYNDIYVTQEVFKNIDEINRFSVGILIT